MGPGLQSFNSSTNRGVSRRGGGHTERAAKMEAVKVVCGHSGTRVALVSMCFALSLSAYI
eukprot:1502783-Amphidinium_carterae.1